MKKINLSKFEKIITKIEKNEKIDIENEYNIDMGNHSYFKVITNTDLNKWILIKINKKSQRELNRNISYKKIFEILFNIAISS